MSQIDKEKTENEIKELSDEYNSNAERLNAAEVKLNAAKDSSFALIKSLYRSYKNQGSSAEELTALESKYEESEANVNSAQVEYCEVLQECFRQIQKLRQLQTNYLMALCNSLQKELTNLKAANPRADNL